MSISTTHWLVELRAGNRTAAQELWERYFSRLVGLARRKLAGMPSACSDEEDVALSAFNSFYQAAEQGRFPQLQRSDDLWRLLMVITARKAINVRKQAGRAKRHIATHRDVAAQGPLPWADDIDQIIGAEPSPDFVAQAIDSCRCLLAGLDDDRLRSIAIWRLEGYTNREIAAKASCSVSTVERKLARIRQQWECEI